MVRENVQMNGRNNRKKNVPVGLKYSSCLANSPTGTLYIQDLDNKYPARVSGNKSLVFYLDWNLAGM